MSNRFKRLSTVFLLAIFTILYWGCTQPPDVLIPVSLSEVSLSPQLLPSNFPGMHYELWVKTSDGSETVSLGKFGYDNELKEFLEVSGAARANSDKFYLEDDIYRFSKLFVSIEENADPDSSIPGPTMLIDDITVPSNSTVDLIFPLHEVLWEATCRYNMETTSDSDRLFQDGYGIWFANYQRLVDSTRDTLALTSFTINYVSEQVLRDTSIINLIDTANVVDSNIIRVFGVDSYTQHVVRFDRVLDTVFANAGDFVNISVPTFTYSIGTKNTFSYDEFTQDSFALPNYDTLGWNYKGWVVSPYVDSSDLGAITPPAWSTHFLGDSAIPGINGGLLTTGTFYDITKPDNANPYKNPASNRVPKFPGEDFITFPTGWNGLAPFGLGNSGTVFITLEPENFVTDTTNFPLIPFVGKVPSDFSDISDDEVIINMLNRTQVTDTRIGFPRVRVGIKTF